MNSSDSYQLANYAVTRRSFLKKSALTAGAISLLASGEGIAILPSTSCPRKVAASPDLGSRFSSTQTFEGCGVKAYTTTTPSLGPADSKIVDLVLHAWADGSTTVVKTSPITVTGSIIHNIYHLDCSFSGNKKDVFGGVVELLIKTDFNEYIHSLAANEWVKHSEKWYAILKITSSLVDSNQAYIQCKAYIYKKEVRDIYLILDKSSTPWQFATTPITSIIGSTSGEFRPDCVEESIWVWKV